MENIQLPDDFIADLREYLPNEHQQLIDALATEPVSSIRLNRRKIDTECSLEKVKWCEDGYYLNDRPTFTMDPLFHAGAYYVQEASSMAIGQVYKQYMTGVESPVVLDLCASPGGKTTHLASLLDGNGFLLSNEVVKTRTKTLCENVSKWGFANTAVCSVMPSSFTELTGLFDMILVDAPCSGEGMFRKDEVAVSEWSRDNVKMCADRQRTILKDVFPALKEDGILIYSTCTFNPHEDDENAQWIADELGADVLDIDFPADSGVTKDKCGYHFYPHKTKGEGFYIAAFRKNQQEDEISIRTKQDKKKGNKGNVSQPTPAEVMKWIDDSSITVADGIAYPTEFEQLIQFLNQNLRLLQYGIPVYIQKGKDIIPQHNLAISNIVNKDFFEKEEVDWEKAIAFLRKDNIEVESDKKGWLMLTYKNVPIGFVKNLGGRANNLYPQNWRILMSADKSRYIDIF